MIRTTLTGIGALDATAWAIVYRSILGHGVLAEEPLEVGSKTSVRLSSLRSKGPSSVINQDGWYTFGDANWYIFNCRLT